MLETLTEDAIALAVINSYKQKGIDMSDILDDPVFSKLNTATKIKALQEYAGVISSGINSSPKGSDARRVAVNAVVDGLVGAITGTVTGAMLGSPHVGIGRSALTGAALLGAGGAVLGGLSAMDDIYKRKILQRSLSNLHSYPTAENAVSVLGNKDVSGAGGQLRLNIINRIGGKIRDSMNDQIGPMINAQHMMASQT